MIRTLWRLVRLVLFLALVAALVVLGYAAYNVVSSSAPLTLTQETATPPAFITLLPDLPTPEVIPSPSPTAIVMVIPSGWTPLTVASDGFAIAVPTGWQQLPLTSAELDATLQLVRERDPELATDLGVRAQELLGSRVKLWAFDFGPDSLGSGMATNLTVTRETFGSSISLDTFVTSNLAALEQLTSRQGPLTHERVMLEGLPAERLRYNLTFQSSDAQTQSAAVTQYLLVSRSAAFVLTYAAPAVRADDYAAIFARSAQTFRIINP